MNYLRTENIHLGHLLRKSKYGYNVDNDRMPWANVGLDESLHPLAVQYGRVTYLPISDDVKIDSHMSNLVADVAIMNTMYEELLNLEIVEDYRAQWLLDKESFNSQE